MARSKATLATLQGLRDSLASFAWRDEELSELVDPRFGIITGFEDLLDELESLRALDLGETPPAQGVSAKRSAP